MAGCAYSCERYKIILKPLMVTFLNCMNKLTEEGWVGVPSDQTPLQTGFCNPTTYNKIDFHDSVREYLSTAFTM